jgi:hypothetical protein
MPCVCDVYGGLCALHMCTPACVATECVWCGRWAWPPGRRVPRVILATISILPSTVFYSACIDKPKHRCRALDHGPCCQGLRSASRCVCEHTRCVTIRGCVSGFCGWRDRWASVDGMTRHAGEHGRWVWSVRSRRDKIHVRVWPAWQEVRLCGRRAGDEVLCVQCHMSYWQIGPIYPIESTV